MYFFNSNPIQSLGSSFHFVLHVYLVSSFQFYLTSMLIWFQFFVAFFFTLPMNQIWLFNSFWHSLFHSFFNWFYIGIHFGSDPSFCFGFCVDVRPFPFNFASAMIWLQFFISFQLLCWFGFGFLFHYGFDIESTSAFQFISTPILIRLWLFNLFQLLHWFSFSFSFYFGFYVAWFRFGLILFSTLQCNS